MKNVWYSIVCISFIAFSVLDFYQVFTEGSIPLWRRSSDVFLSEEPFSFWVEITYRLLGLCMLYYIFVNPIFKKRNKTNINHHSRKNKKKKRRPWR